MELSFQEKARRRAEWLDRLALYLAVTASAVVIAAVIAVGATNECTRPRALTYIGGGAVLVAVPLALLATIGSVLMSLFALDRRLFLRGLATTAGLTLILLIAPSMLPRAERSNADGAGIANLKTIATAQVTYMASHDNKYGTLEDLTRDGLIDERFRGAVSGYHYTVALGPNGYTATAVKDASNCLARWEYYMRADAVVHYSADPSRAPDGAAGLPVQ